MDGGWTGWFWSEGRLLSLDSSVGSVGGVVVDVMGTFSRVSGGPSYYLIFLGMGPSVLWN